MAQIFISHSRRDSDIKRFFSDIFGRTHVKAFFLEYEKFNAPSWPIIQQHIAGSAAMFVLLGTHVQQLAHTQVWIGSESATAVSLGKEVWVFEHREQICDVGIPSVTNYAIYDESEAFQDWIRMIVESYDDLPVLQAGLAGALDGLSLTAHLVQPGAQLGGAIVGAILASQAAASSRVRPVGLPVQCPHPNCKAIFAFQNRVEQQLVIPCPVCRQHMTLRPP